MKAPSSANETLPAADASAGWGRRGAPTHANSRLELAGSIAFGTGPASAGALVAWAGARAGFFVAVVLSAAAAVLLLRLPAAPAGTTAALTAACLAVTLAVPSVVLSGLCFFLPGAGPMAWTTTATLRQSMAPEALFGRVSAVFLTVTAGVWPVGAALRGAIGRVEAKRKPTGGAGGLHPAGAHRPTLRSHRRGGCRRGPRPNRRQRWPRRPAPSSGARRRETFAWPRSVDAVEPARRIESTPSGGS